MKKEMKTTVQVIEKMMGHAFRSLSLPVTSCHFLSLLVTCPHTCLIVPNTQHEIRINFFRHNLLDWVTFVDPLWPHGELGEIWEGGESMRAENREPQKRRGEEGVAQQRKHNHFAVRTIFKLKPIKFISKYSEANQRQGKSTHRNNAHLLVYNMACRVALLVSVAVMLSGCYAACPDTAQLNLWSAIIG